MWGLYLLYLLFGRKLFLLLSECREFIFIVLSGGLKKKVILAVRKDIGKIVLKG